MNQSLENVTPARKSLGLIASEDLARMLNILPTTLREWRRMGKGPDYLRLGKRAYYRQKDVDAWIEEQLVFTNRSELVGGDA